MLLRDLRLDYQRQPNHFVKTWLFAMDLNRIPTHTFPPHSEGSSAMAGENIRPLHICGHQSPHSQTSRISEHECVTSPPLLSPLTPSHCQQGDAGRDGDHWLSLTVPEERISIPVWDSVLSFPWLSSWNPWACRVRERFVSIRVSSYMVFNLWIRNEQRSFEGRVNQYLSEVKTVAGVIVV